MGLNVLAVLPECTSLKAEEFESPEEVLHRCPLPPRKRKRLGMYAHSTAWALGFDRRPPNDKSNPQQAGADTVVTGSNGTSTSLSFAKGQTTVTLLDPGPLLNGE